MLTSKLLWMASTSVQEHTTLSIWWLEIQEPSLPQILLDGSWLESVKVLSLDSQPSLRWLWLTKKFSLKRSCNHLCQPFASYFSPGLLLPCSFLFSILLALPFSSASFRIERLEVLLTLLTASKILSTKRMISTKRKKKPRKIKKVQQLLRLKLIKWNEPV